MSIADYSPHEKFSKSCAIHTYPRKSIPIFVDLLLIQGPRHTTSSTASRWVEKILLPEQYDPHTERLLGNHPQVYFHLGLINAAIALSKANGT